MTEILLVDDAEDTWFLVKRALGNQFRVTCAATVSEAMSMLHQRRFDLLILDITLPDGEGFQICAQVRSADETRRIPIVFLSGRIGIANLVTGFSLGADDYIEKPFDPLELSARINAKIKRSRSDQESEDKLLSGRLKLELFKQKISILDGGTETEVELTPIEFKLLHHFMKNEERLLNRQQLLNAVWGDSTFIVDRTVDKHICSLRQKLLSCASYIQTVPSFGYRYSVEVMGGGILPATG